jgi:hypothetical protein
MTQIAHKDRKALGQKFLVLRHIARCAGSYFRHKMRVDEIWTFRHEAAKETRRRGGRGIGWIVKGYGAGSLADARPTSIRLSALTPSPTQHLIPASP